MPLLDLSFQFILVTLNENTSDLTVECFVHESTQIHLETGPVKFWNKQILESMATLFLTLKMLHDSDVTRFRTQLKTAIAKQ